MRREGGGRKGVGRREGRFWPGCSVTDTGVSGSENLTLVCEILFFCLTPPPPSTLTFLSHFTADTLGLPSVPGMGAGGGRRPPRSFPEAFAELL